MLLTLDTIIYVVRFHLDDTVALSSLVSASKALRNALLSPTLVHTVLLRNVVNKPIQDFFFQILHRKGSLATLPLWLCVELGKLLCLDAAAGRISYDPCSIWDHGLLLGRRWRSSVLPYALEHIPQFPEWLQIDTRRIAVVALHDGFDIESPQYLIDAQCFDLPRGLAEAISWAKEQLVAFLLQFQPAGLPAGYWRFHHRSFTSEQKIRIADMLIDAGFPISEVALDEAVDDLPYLQHLLHRWNGRRPLGAKLLSRSMRRACSRGKLDAIKMLVSRGASLVFSCHNIHGREDERYDGQVPQDATEPPLLAALEGAASPPICSIQETARYVGRPCPNLSPLHQ
ncbi:hypothetical protein HDU87_001465 [Geranomyces variabilis]|uniref:Uncharacterized protein n=1 Tax=Geranomyces variabilis TaxID=109894 RepID=A0AAD5TDI8_9FUNG|nr:hypothetical protein HDU87_001465 [Geranomyces variabilis]